jgi:hypothetical protein
MSRLPFFNFSEIIDFIFLLNLIKNSLQINKLFKSIKKTFQMEGFTIS